MNITLNGKPREFSDSLKLSEILQQLGFSGKPVVVEYNKEAIFPRDYAQTIVKDGDLLEIISIAAGG